MLDKFWLPQTKTAVRIIPGYQRDTLYIPLYYVISSNHCIGTGYFPFLESEWRKLGIRVLEIEEDVCYSEDENDSLVDDV